MRVVEVEGEGMVCVVVVTMVEVVGGGEGHVEGGVVFVGVAGRRMDVVVSEVSYTSSWRALSHAYDTGNFGRDEVEVEKAYRIASWYAWGGGMKRQ